jgi:hypothetical protein
VTFLLLVAGAALHYWRLFVTSLLVAGAISASLYNPGPYRIEDAASNCSVAVQMLLTVVGAFSYWSEIFLGDVLIGYF